MKCPVVLVLHGDSFDSSRRGVQPRGSATVPWKRAWMLVFKNADSMSSWRHEIHDFQTGNFLNLTAKGCAYILFTKYFFCIKYYNTTNVLFVLVAVKLCRVSERANLPEKRRLRIVW
jgi:hypothetical protein